VKYLVFPRAGARVRLGAFRERSLLPVSAACVVANGMREHLARLCGADVDLRLWPPAIPERDAWQEIFRGAQLYAIRGTRCDAAIVLRAADAQGLAALLFGERSIGATRALSSLECEVSRRAVERITGTLAPVCGDATLDPKGRNCGYVTYFELHVLEPVQFCIGVALSREPAPARAAPLAPEHLMHARVAATVEVPLVARRAGELAALEPGDLLEKGNEPALLRVGGRIVARGTCGVRAHRYAFEVRERA
jgi:hypothetical protein